MKACCFNFLEHVRLQLIWQDDTTRFAILRVTVAEDSVEIVFWDFHSAAQYAESGYTIIWISIRASSAYEFKEINVAEHLTSRAHR